MHTALVNGDAPHAGDVLFNLELTIARRADELVRTHGRQGGLNLDCWCLAEREILGTRNMDPAPVPPSEVPELALA
jgi:hypothetical protein